MAYVAENKKFNTNYGKIKNNNSRNTIERNNVALFNFSISEVTVEDGGLTVVCDTITGDTIEYSLDLDGDKCEFTEEMYNYTVGGSIEIFLALVWKLYLSTLDDEGVQQDTETYEQLKDIIAELTKDKDDLTKANSDLTTANETLSGQVETLQGQLEAAQSQAGSTGVQAYQKFTVDNKEYNIKIVGNDTGKVFFTINDENLPDTVYHMGFTSQQGTALFKNTNDNTTINFELYIDGTVQTAGGVGASYQLNYLTTTPVVDFIDGKPVCVKVTVADSSNEVLSSAYDSMTYVAPASESEGEGE